MTWDHLIQHVENLNVQVDLETPRALPKEPELDAVLGSGLRVNLDTMYLDPSSTLQTKEGENLEEIDV